MRIFSAGRYMLLSAQTWRLSGVTRCCRTGSCRRSREARCTRIRCSAATPPPRARARAENRPASSSFLVGGGRGPGLAMSVAYPLGAWRSLGRKWVFVMFHVLAAVCAENCKARILWDSSLEDRFYALGPCFMVGGGVAFPFFFPRLFCVLGARGVLGCLAGGVYTPNGRWTLGGAEEAGTRPPGSPS